MVMSLNASKIKAIADCQKLPTFGSEKRNFAARKSEKKDNLREIILSERCFKIAPTFRLKIIKITNIFRLRIRDLINKVYFIY